MKNPKDGLFGKNVFSEAFQQFDEDSFFQSLHNTVRNRSYFDKYKGFKTTVLYLSYLFNFASMLTASYAIFWLTEWLTGLVWLGYVVGGVFLFFLEKIKRKSSSELFQVLFFRKQIAYGWLGLSLFCFGISLAASGFGVKSGTDELSPDPELIAADSTAQAYRQEIAKLEAENAHLAKQTNHEGTIYYRLQSAMNKNTSMIEDYTKRVLKLDEQLEGKNELLSTEYELQVEETGWSLVGITILMELLFEACIAYIWFFYYRSYVERKQFRGFSNGEPVAIDVPLDSTAKKGHTFDELFHLIHQLKDEIEDLKSLQFSSRKVTSLQKEMPSQNGIDGNVQNLSATRIQGFLTDQQKKKLQDEQSDGKIPVQVCTEVYMDTKREVDDQFTVPHKYMKAGKLVIARYTLPQIESRIAQYQREVDESERRAMGEEIIENRKKWLTYWGRKKEELLNKISSLPAA